LGPLRLRPGHWDAACTAFPDRVVAGAWAGRDEDRPSANLALCLALVHDFRLGAGRDSLSAVIARVQQLDVRRDEPEPRQEKQPQDEGR
jgi:hypothetical protein